MVHPQMHHGLERPAIQMSLRHFPIHLKILEAGMSRL